MVLFIAFVSADMPGLYQKGNKFWESYVDKSKTEKYHPTMKRRSVFVCAIFIAISVSPTAHAVTAGSSCTKKGSTVTQSGKKYTCIALGKKLYWDNGVKIPAALICSEATAGQLNGDKSKRCVMIDDLVEDGLGGYKKIYELVAAGGTPNGTLCRHSEQFWSNQTWYDGKWKCGYFVDGSWSSYGWHKSASQYPDAIETTYVVGGSTSKSTSNSTQTKVCSTSSNIVRANLGSDSSQGAGNLIAFIFENTSDCNLGISASVTVLCPNGGVLKLSNNIRTTGAFALRSKERLAVTGLNFNRYFPQATQQCRQLTGYSTNLVQLSDLVGPGPSVMVTSATP